jgi:hypothetical protein
LAALKGFVLCFLVSVVTLPFVDALWLGELPVVAALQVPKVLIAGWIRMGVVMPAIEGLGLSSGSFSPDYSTARPYALALAYLIPVVALLAVTWLRTRMAKPYRFWSCLLLCVAALDYLLTLRLTHTPGLTLY